MNFCRVELGSFAVDYQEVTMYCFLFFSGLYIDTRL